MAADFNLTRSAEIARLLSEVIALFEPFACRSWLEWGGRILFVQYQSKVEAEDRQLEEARRREEEERVKKAAAEARVEGFRERRRALAEERRRVLGEYRGKTLSKEGLQARNAELEAEARAIDRDEGGELGNEEEEIGEKRDEERLEGEEFDGLPVIRTRKRKVTVVEDNEGEEEKDELEEEVMGGEMKRARLDMVPAFEFEGPVSVLTKVFEPTNVIFCVVRSMRDSEGRTAVRRC
jgi:hypothetical protein